ncbi:MAG: hypothetical protein HYU58_05910 [Proteobacteria bacterium]|nr:hypothetical protein [Pseudomonadota bacterium]
MLAYALLIQSILGPAVAGAHAFAMAQHEALGLTALCADGSVTSNEPAHERQAPEGDCFSCKIACTASFGVAALPVPETAATYVATDFAQLHLLPPADDEWPSPVRYKSDLASRAPPASLI